MLNFNGQFIQRLILWMTAMTYITAVGLIGISDRFWPGAAVRCILTMVIKRSFRTSFKLQANVRLVFAPRNRNDLMARLSALLEFDLTQGDAKGFGDEFQQRFVGTAFDGRSGEAYLQGIPMQSGHLTAFRAGLHMQGQG